MGLYQRLTFTIPSMASNKLIIKKEDLGPTVIVLNF